MNDALTHKLATLDLNLLRVFCTVWYVNITR
jgi:hypothetical protein